MGYRNPITAATDPTARAAAGAAQSTANLAYDQAFNGIIPGTRLAADAINGKTITGATITGGTVTGATVQTAATGQRATLTTANGLRFWSGDSAEAIPGSLARRAVTGYNSLDLDGGGGNAPVLSLQYGQLGAPNGPSSSAALFTRCDVVEMSRLQLDSTADASATSTAHAIQVGPSSGQHLRGDGNEWGAYDGTSGTVVSSPMFLQDPRAGGAAQNTAGAALVRYDHVHGLIASGFVTITPSAAGTATSANITFGKTFPSAPVVVCTANSSAANVTMVGATGVTTTGATIWITRGSTTATGIYWVAVASSV